MGAPPPSSSEARALQGDSRLTIWDASGNDKIRGMWGSYCASEEGMGGTPALIWVADMSDVRIQ